MKDSKKVLKNVVPVTRANNMFCAQPGCHGSCKPISSRIRMLPGSDNGLRGLRYRCMICEEVTVASPVYITATSDEALVNALMTKST